MEIKHWKCIYKGRSVQEWKSVGDGSFQRRPIQFGGSAMPTFQAENVELKAFLYGEGRKRPPKARAS